MTLISKDILGDDYKMLISKEILGHNYKKTLISKDILWQKLQEDFNKQGIFVGQNKILIKNLSASMKHQTVAEFLTAENVPSSSIHLMKVVYGEEQLRYQYILALRNTFCKRRMILGWCNKSLCHSSAADQTHRICLWWTHLTEPTIFSTRSCRINVTLQVRERRKSLKIFNIGSCAGSNKAKLTLGSLDELL